MIRTIEELDKELCENCGIPDNYKETAEGDNDTLSFERFLDNLEEKHRGQIKAERT